MSILSNHHCEVLDELNAEPEADRRVRAARKPRPKPARSIQILVRPNILETGVVRITVGKKHADYFINEFAAGYGRGFELEKISVVGPEAVYHINIEPHGRSCDCLGSLQHGHCKHADGLAALTAAGRL